MLATVVPRRQKAGDHPFLPPMLPPPSLPSWQRLFVDLHELGSSFHSSSNEHLLGPYFQGDTRSGAITAGESTDACKGWSQLLRSTGDLV